MDIDLAIIGMMSNSAGTGFPDIDMAAWDFSGATIIDGKISAVADLSGHGYNLSQTDDALRPLVGGVFTGTQFLNAVGFPEISGRKINVIQKVTGWTQGSVFSKSFYGVSPSRYSLYRTNNTSVNALAGSKDTSMALASGFTGVIELECNDTTKKVFINNALSRTVSIESLTNNPSELAYVGRYASNSTVALSLVGTVSRIAVAFNASESDLTMLRGWVNAG
jgi:hypothetical protein